MATFNLIYSGEVSIKRIHLAQNPNDICVFVLVVNGEVYVIDIPAGFFKFSTIFSLKVIVLKYLLIFLSLHCASLRDIKSAHQLMHIHKIVYIRTFKIAPTRFDPEIIIRELHRSLLKSHY